MTAINDLVALGEPRRYPERIAALTARVAELEAENERVQSSTHLLVDALNEFHEFVTEHLDPDPHPIGAYLVWRSSRVAELYRLLRRRA